MAVGVASGGFAFINGAAAVELIAAAVAGATGQWFRTWLLRNRYNQYGAAALTALTASGAYVLLAALMRNVGLEIVNFPAGFMGSVLLLKAGEVQANSRIRAEQLIADLHKKRDEFQNAAKKQADAGEAAWLHTKSQLEGTWNGFETEVKKYVETFGKQIQQQQTTFQDAAAAQLREAWRDAAETIQTAATGLAMHRRSDIDAAVTRMKADASKAEANLQELNRAGTESWAALNGALAESRRGLRSRKSGGMGCSQARRHS